MSAAENTIVEGFDCFSKTLKFLDSHWVALVSELIGLILEVWMIIKIYSNTDCRNFTLYEIKHSSDYLTKEYYLAKHSLSGSELREYDCQIYNRKLLDYSKVLLMLILTIIQAILSVLKAFLHKYKYCGDLLQLISFFFKGSILIFVFDLVQMDCNDKCAKYEKEIDFKLYNIGIIIFGVGYYLLFIQFFFYSLYKLAVKCCCDQNYNNRRCTSCYNKMKFVFLFITECGVAILSFSYSSVLGIVSIPFIVSIILIIIEGIYFLIKEWRKQNQENNKNYTSVTNNDIAT